MIYITDDNLQPACDYIQSQFNAHSWWPKAQPNKARREFTLMNQSSGALDVWCERWLDRGQLRKLERKI